MICARCGDEIDGTIYGVVKLVEKDISGPDVEVETLHESYLCPFCTNEVCGYLYHYIDNWKEKTMRVKTALGETTEFPSFILGKGNEKLATGVPDMVNHPPHYTQGDIECIEAIKASMPQREFIGYLKGQVMKYIWRFEDKNSAEDLEKAQFYLNRLHDEFVLSCF